ncbi:MAG: GH36 C-terminal domain-containing protein [Lachnospiraceae bacterium]|nr:GH36 C-terminal domain-containing protein [Lachnospiraceae bacterium]
MPKTFSKAVLDLTKISDGEKDKIKEQVAFYRKHMPLIMDGRYYRLTNPFTDGTAAWQYVSEDKKEVLFQAVQLEIHGNMTPVYVRLKGLEEGVLYKEGITGGGYPADLLMEIGLTLRILKQEYSSYQMKFVKERELYGRGI